MKGCRFISASLQRTNLSLAELDGADFSGANLTGANLSDTGGVRNFGKAILDGAILQRVKFPEGNFAGALLEGADLGHAMLEGADLSDTNLMSAKLHGTNLQGAKLDRAAVDGAVFERASLGKASLRDLRGEMVSFRRADLTECVVEGSRLVLSTLDYATLGRAKLVNTIFDGASLVGATLSRVTIENCSFAGADFTDAVTAGVDFGSAQLTGAKSDPTVTRKRSVRAKISASQRRWLFRKSTDSGTSMAPSSIALSYSRDLEHRLVTLLRTRDELQQSLERQAKLGQPEGGERKYIESSLEEIKDQCRLLENQVARGNEHVRKLQEELSSRVALAVDGLMIVAKPLNRTIWSLRAWEWATAAFGAAFLGLAAWRLGLEGMIIDGTQTERVAALEVGGIGSTWLVTELVLVAVGLVSLCLASKASRRLSFWIQRRERIQKCMAVLVASQYIDFEMDAKQSNVTRTFEAVRASLLDADDPSERPS